jgi:hypothetical protein
VTLVLAVATPTYSLHVSDRLVSKGGAPHDRLANKTVVFRATDGVLAFGYTGPAFIDNIPTDTWLADALADGCCASGEVGAMRLGDFPVATLVPRYDCTTVSRGSVPALTARRRTT